MREHTTDESERWRQVFEAEQSRLWQSLLAHTGDGDLAADATAEAFAQGLRRGPEVRDPAAWVWRSSFRIANGMLADQSRHATSGGDDALRRVAATGALPDEVAALLDALGHLSPADRQLVVLTLVGGFSSAEVGHIVGAGAGAVRVRLHRARSRLRDALDEPQTPRSENATPTITPSPLPGSEH